ncbi:MAG: hypothetical protein HY653_06655, partial [Acidobacteria bacterium]|nr:hypothetical protein [Acidobacteriota bacterium]
MNIALDIRRIQDFGAGTYTRNLVRQLARLDPVHRYWLVGTADDVGELGSLPENFCPLDWDGVDGRWRHAWRLSWRFHQLKIRLYHIPYLATPLMVPCPYI